MNYDSDTDDAAWNYIKVIYNKEFVSQYPDVCELIKQLSDVMNKKKIYKGNEAVDAYVIQYKGITFWFAPDWEKKDE
jgi:Holliday junction resolvase RusA-like endonuclease